MEEVRNDRLFLQGPGLIFYCMKKATYYHAPTPEELYAFDKRAREERARYVGELVSAAATALKFRLERAFSALTGKVVRHA
jgi:hypothetical protein